MTRPFFMFGFERSGTTLLSMMVGAHPEIAVPFSSTGMWYRFGRALDRYNGLAAPDDIARLVDDLLREERILLWNVSLDRDALVAGARPGDYPSVVGAFHAEYARQSGKTRWGNIDIATLFDMDLAQQWFPDARFVHIVRDGRDVALSHETYAYGTSNAAECAENWVSALHTSLKMGAILGPDRYLVIRYEDLVRDSEATLRAICAFIGADYSRAMLDYPNVVSDRVPDSRRWLWPGLDKAPDQANVDRWKTGMGQRKRAVFERIAAPMLERLGYETQARIPAGPGVQMLELWYFLGRGHRFERLRKKLGFPSKRRSGGARSAARSAPARRASAM